MPVSSSRRSWADRFGISDKAGLSPNSFRLLREGMFFGAVGQKAEVTDTHEAIGQDVEQGAADEVFGIEGHRF